MAKSKNKAAVPEAKGALGGYMVKKMIEAQERQMSGK